MSKSTYRLANYPHKCTQFGSWRDEKWMILIMYTSNELFFPFSIVPSIKTVYGNEWYTLVKQVEELPEDHPEALAFVLMMSKINGCVTCETDSFRAMKGCLACSLQTLRRMKDEPERLMLLLEESRAEILAFLVDNPQFTSSSMKSD